MKHKLLFDASVAIPITIGIIGHRDAIITEDHRNHIKNLFEDIFQNYSDTPIYFLSQLAEGADCDIAELFLETCKKNDGLIVPVPFEVQAYIKTFKNKEHEQRFNQLISKAKRYFQLAGVPVDDNEQNKFFRKGGKFVADSSIILIVLWDGRGNDLIGGVADIVHYKKHGAFSDDDLRNIYESPAHFIEIRCNRLSKKIMEIHPLKGRLLKQVLNDINIAKALQNIQKLNKEEIWLKKQRIEESLKNLITEKDRLDEDSAMLAGYYSLTDRIAIKKQWYYHLSLSALFLLGFVIIVVFEFYKHLLREPYSLSGVILLVGVAVCISYIAKKKGFHMRFIEARVLAEALRVQFFWNMVGLQKNAGQHILRIYEKEYDWIKYILNAIYGVTFPDLNKWNFTSVKEYWLESQKSYFEDSVKKVKATRKKLNNISNIAFYFALTMLSLMLIFHRSLKQAEILDDLIIGTGILFGIFGLLKGYIEKRGYAQIINQRELMANIFNATLKRVNHLDSQTAHQIVQTLLHQAGIESLIENGNWYLIYKDKEPNIEGVGG